MSRIHDALGHGEAARRPPGARQPLGQLSWAPGSRTARRRERPGLGDYLRRGILIGGLLWVGWWLTTGLDWGATPEPAGAVAAPAAAVAPVAGALETQVSDPPPDEPPAPTGPSAIVTPPAGVPPVPVSVPQAPAPPLPDISAILLSEGRRLAVVDGRVLGVGQHVGSWELVSVDRDAVVLRDPSGIERVVTLNQ